MRNWNKQVIWSAVLTVLLVGGTFIQESMAQREIVNYCERDRAADKNKSMLKPYRYSTNKSKRITLKEYNQIEETIVELLHDVPYKIIFNRSGLPDGQEVHIFIYDDKYGKKNREVIWKDAGSDEIVEMETEELNDQYDKLYIEYELPAYQKDIPENMQIKGCVTMTTGYNNMRLHSDRK